MGGMNGPMPLCSGDKNKRMYESFKGGEEGDVLISQQYSSGTGGRRNGEKTTASFLVPESDIYTTKGKGS